MRKFLILAVFTLKFLVANSQVDSVKSIITTKTIGQFLITTHDSIEVIVKVDKVKYLGMQIPGLSSDGEADVSIRVENKEKGVYYIRNLSTTDNALRDIKSIDLTIGKALILVYGMYPCLGRGCESFQIFGFNELGYFVPFTGIIDLADGENAEQVSHFKLKWMDNHGTEVPSKKDVSFYPNNNQLYIEVPDIFILSEVQTLTYYPIYSSGQWYDKDYKQDDFGKSPIFYNNSNIIVINEKDIEKFRKSKILYTQPNTLTDYKYVNFKTNTVVKLLDMTRDSESWVHLTIDGMEGYMTLNDFENAGFDIAD
jgi:hypothetical protein